VCGEGEAVPSPAGSGPEVSAAAPAHHLPRCLLRLATITGVGRTRRKKVKKERRERRGGEGRGWEGPPQPGAGSGEQAGRRWDKGKDGWANGWARHRGMGEGRGLIFPEKTKALDCKS